MILTDAGIPKRAATALNKKGIYTIDDLARYTPMRYQDYREIVSLDGAAGQDCVIAGYLERVKKDKTNQRTMLKGYLIEATTGQRVSLTWFGMAFIWSKLEDLNGKEVFVCGKVKFDETYGYQMTNPAFIGLKASFRGRMVPIYRKIKNVSEEKLKEYIDTAISLSEETLEDEVLKKGIWAYKRALDAVHHPKDPEAVKKGKMRLAIDELLNFSLEIKTRPKATAYTRYVARKTDLSRQVIKELPYKLTDDQNSALSSIVGDMKKGNRANYLVQGDVSCGKTIVAFICAFAMAENGYQVAIMAPTTTLAGQHYGDLKPLADKYGFEVAYLHSGLTAKERKEELKKIADGAASFIVGTHSVISNDVEYKDLSLVITDEEHRFGVNQRESLIKKAGDGAHVISMSATPIPRTVATVLFGEDKKIIEIKTMPGGRKPVLTYVNNNDEDIIRFISHEIGIGHQAYIVCPLIEEADDDSRIADIRSVEEAEAIYGPLLLERGITYTTVTGRDKEKDKAEKLESFRSGESKVLFSTTVIEVGVNVPAASLIVITNAEMFGLATLHQLRGRVGRGSEQAYCVLASSDYGNPRLAVMKETTDGFEIAKADLELRGMGDILGTQQSGANHTIELVMRMPEMYRRVQDLAEFMIKRGYGGRLISLYREKEEIRSA